MRWRIVWGGVVILCATLGFIPATAHAEGLKIQPTLLRDSLNQGERKKGYIDISNPEKAPVAVKFSVETFRQVDDQGSLGFQKDDRVSAGVKLDLDNAELAPKDVLRLYYMIDGTKLPTGDVFAVIFAETTPSLKQNTTQLSARVGTLLVLSNGTPSSHTADVTELNVPAFQFGEALRANVMIKNSAPAGQATGFFPDLTLSMWPYGDKRLEGPLVFAGHSRAVSIYQPGNYFGLTRVEIGSGMSKKSGYTFLVTGWFRWGVFLLMAILSGILLAVIKWRSKQE